MLKKTNVKLDIFTEERMFNFLESNVRGGISTRYSRANNIFMNDYDETKESSYIMSLDANNLYGHSMSQKLPVGDFRFLSDDEINNFCIENIDTEGDIGYICEVDLKYPKELHDLHKDYPLAPEHMAVKEHMLSNYCKNILRDNNQKHYSSKKLIPNLYNKEKYVCHIRN